MTHHLALASDEAHRSQYDFIDGFARHMRDALPHASFVGFTGTPIEQPGAPNCSSRSCASTRAAPLRRRR